MSRCRLLTVQELSNASEKTQLLGSFDGQRTPATKVCFAWFRVCFRWPAVEPANIRLMYLPYIGGSDFILVPRAPYLCAANLTHKRQPDGKGSRRQTGREDALITKLTVTSALKHRTSPLSGNLEGYMVYMPT